MTATTGAPRDPSTRWLLWGGVVGPLLFIAVFLIVGATRPGYDPRRHVVSALSLGPQGWQQIGNFVVSGALILGSAVGLRRVLRPGQGATWGPILIGFVGAGLMASGPFVMDPVPGYPPGSQVVTTMPGTVHAIIGALVFTALPIAAFVLARRFLGDPAWRWLGLYSVVTGIVLVALIVLMKAVQLSPDPNAPMGLVQRITIVVGWVWMAIVAFALVQTPPRRQAG